MSGHGMSEGTCHAAEVLRSFLEEVADAQSTMFGNPSDERLVDRTSSSSAREERRREPKGEWALGSLEDRLRKLSSLKVGGLVETRQITAAVPGLAYTSVDALVRLLIRLLTLAARPARCARGNDTIDLRIRPQEAAVPSRETQALIDLALLCLADLLESPSWRHIFFRVLHDVQLEREESEHPAVAGRGAMDSGDSTLQGHIWRMIICEVTTATISDKAKSAGGDDGARAPSSLVSPVNHAAVRFCCNMIRHSPFSFPASSYAALAPHLADYLLASGGSKRDADDGASGRERPDRDLMVLLDLFAACARGSPHFRQYVKGLRRKRELLRQLLAFLGPQFDGRIVVRGLCALARVLAGDTLEGKVFEPGNALETASLVTENLLDLSGNVGQGRSRGRLFASGQLGEQRRYADVAADLARSRVFMSALVDTDRLTVFLREAVAVLSRAAACISAHVHSTRMSGGDACEIDDGKSGHGGGKVRWQDFGIDISTSNSQEAPRSEPLLRALCSFCLEHSPARSSFVQALVGSPRPPEDNANTRGAESTSNTDAAPAKIDSCFALFVLCRHPHLPTAAAASTLLQCLLVGGGALGAVSGPSPGAAAGVGIIPAGFQLGGGSACFGGGIGREDPLQAALLERIDVAVLDYPKEISRRRRRDRVGTAIGGENVPHEMVMMGNVNDNSSADHDSSSAGDHSDDLDSDGDDRDADRAWTVGVDGSRSSLAGDNSASSGALHLLIDRVRQIGAGLASAQAKEQMAGGTKSRSRKRSMAFVGAGGGNSRDGNKEDTAWPYGCGGARFQGGAFIARAVEMEEELTSLLCLLSSLALASPSAARVLGRALPLEVAFTPILAAQRAVLAGVDPADFPRAPVEIVLVSLTLVAQLGVALSRDGCWGRSGIGDDGVRGATRRRRGGNNATEDGGVGTEVETDSRTGREGKGRRTQEKRRRMDVARAARLRRYIGEQAAIGEVKLCIGHAACRAESKDLARRVASLISLLQAGGGADALLVADALYAFAQSAENREADLRSRVAAAEAKALQERGAGERRAAALKEAEGLVAQIEARNAEELHRLSEQESGVRRRLEDAHSRTVVRAELSLRRAEETAADLEKALRSKEDDLRCVGREVRAKNLEIASLRGDLAGEQRLRAAAEVKLEDACAERDQLSRGKEELEGFLDATKAEVVRVRQEGLVSLAGFEEEKGNAARGWAAARDAEDGLKRSNARVEEAFRKLILLARGYNIVEEKSRKQEAEAGVALADALAKSKSFQDQAVEEERRHSITMAALKDGETSLQWAEDRLATASGEAAQAQAVAAAARTAGREAMEKVSSAEREAKLRREEAMGLRAELQRARAACAEKDLELTNKCKELGQQAGIIEYINKLSSNAAEAVVAAKAVVTVGHGDRVTSVPADSEGHSQKC